MLEMFCVVAPFDQTNVKGPVPLLIVIEMDPVLSPLHRTFVKED